MQHDIMWGPLLLFFGALGLYALVEHLRARPRRRAHRSKFRRMQSPYARARRRSQGGDSGAPQGFERSERVAVQHGFAHAPQGPTSRGFHR